VPRLTLYWDFVSGHRNSTATCTKSLFAGIGDPLSSMVRKAHTGGLFDGVAQDLVKIIYVNKRNFINALVLRA
jgi:hypothetical protein